MLLTECHPVVPTFCAENAQPQSFLEEDNLQGRLVISYSRFSNMYHFIILAPETSLFGLRSLSCAQMRLYWAAFQRLGFSFYQHLKEEMVTWLQLKSPFLISQFILWRDYAINSSLSSTVENGQSLLTNPSASTFTKLRIPNLSCFLPSVGFISSEPKLVLRYNNFHLYFLVVISPFFHVD